jgi:type IV secretion system protein VirB5
MTDYTQVIRKYQSDKALAQKNLRYWQLISLGLLVITGSSVYHLATQREGIEIKPYLVQVDKIGTAVASGLLEDSQFDVEHNEKIIRALLFRYIQQAKGISSDATVMQSNLKDVHRMTIPSLYTHYLMPFYEKDDPFISAATFTRTVRPINFLRQSPKTFIVEWEEDDRDNSKQLIKTTRWKAYIGIKTEQKTTKSQIEEDIFNPLGIYVTNLEWSPNL